MSKRNTKSKQLVLDILQSRQNAFCHEEILSTLKDQVDRATIYRILNSFCEDGIVHRVVSEEGKQYFAMCSDCSGEKHYHKHLHFKCLNCQKVECLHNEVNINLPQGYAIESLNAILSGYCPTCSENKEVHA